MTESAGCDRFSMAIYGTRGTLLAPLAARAIRCMGAGTLFGREWSVPSLPEAPLGDRQHAAWLAGVARDGVRLSTARDALRGMRVVEAVDAVERRRRRFGRGHRRMKSRLPLRVGVLSFAHYHANFWSEIFAQRGVLAGVWDDDAAAWTRGGGAFRHRVSRFARRSALATARRSRSAARPPRTPS